MDQNIFISIYLDTRRKKKSGLFPVRLRVFTKQPRVQKLFSTRLDMSEAEFAATWTHQPKSEYKAKNKLLRDLQTKAEQIASELEPFTFERFEKKLYRKAGDEIRLSYLYEERIKEMRERDQIKNASNYELAEKSIMRFIEAKTRRSYDRLTLLDIDSKWLNDYEHYMTKELERSSTTVSMYVRTLRTLFNHAIDEGDIDRDLYPFGKRKYVVPGTSKTKKALDQEQLKTLLNATPLNDYQRKARDFWFFSYVSNGMNIKDICNLKFKDIDGDTFHFYRQKTLLTGKKNRKAIAVHLHPFAKQVIKEYGNQRQSDMYVFDILKPGMTAIEKNQQVQIFTRFINQHIKKMAASLGLPEAISTYWARHSFATQSITKGASMEFIQESLGHSDVKTTQIYFSGFDDEKKKQFAETLLNFD